MRLAASMTLVLALAGCAHSTLAPQKKGAMAADYYPLEVGNSWTYDANHLGKKDSEEHRLLETDSNGFVVDSTGARLKADGFGVRDERRYLLREPVEVGTKWTNVVSAQSIEHYEIIAAGQPCDAPAGSFAECVIVQSTNRDGRGNTLVNEMTFARGIGLVALSIVLDHQGKRVPQHSYVLTKYTVARAP